MPLFLLIFGLPLAEIAAFVIVGQWLGVFGVLGLVLASTLLGVILLRGAGGRGGLADLRSAMERRGGDAGAAMARQAFRAGAAVMLIVPGLLTSAFGLVLLIPAVQRMIVARMGARMTVVRTGAAAGTRQGDDIIEGSYTELPPGHRRKDAPSPWNDQG
jgi:UPF0716 protein FxsA